MLAIAAATAGSRLLSEDTIYTLKLRRRGADLAAPARSEPFRGLTVGAAMRLAPTPLAASLTTTDAARRLVQARVRSLPVANGDGALVGVVSRADLERALVDDEDPPPVGQLARPARGLTPDDPLEHAARLLADDADALPVVDRSTLALVGWITDRDVLAAIVRRNGSPMRTPRT